MIVPIERVRAAYERALARHPDADAAAAAVAQSLGLDVEAVRDVVQEPEPAA